MHALRSLYRMQLSHEDAATTLERRRPSQQCLSGFFYTPQQLLVDSGCSSTAHGKRNRSHATRRTALLLLSLLSPLSSLLSSRCRHWRLCELHPCVLTEAPSAVAAFDCLACARMCVHVRVCAVESVEAAVCDWWSGGSHMFRLWLPLVFPSTRVPWLRYGFSIPYCV